MLHRFGLLLFSIGWCATGCGQSGLVLVPVHGMVTLDQQPLQDVDVILVPRPGTTGAGGRARTREDGSFDVDASIGGSTTQRFGVVAGRYSVTVSTPEFIVVNDIPVFRKPGEPSRVPVRYGVVETSGLEVEVIVGMPDVVLELQSK
jgi:hypothetical protein